MSKDILEEIIAHKRIEIAGQEKVVSAAFLEKQLGEPVPPRSLKQALMASPTGIIAEFKRRSPSKGWIHQDADAGKIPAAYQQAGAAALSILTDEAYFGGTLNYDQPAHLAQGLHHQPIPIVAGKGSTGGRRPLDSLCIYPPSVPHAGKRSTRAGTGNLAGNPYRSRAGLLERIHRRSGRQQPTPGHLPHRCVPFAPACRGIAPRHSENL